jgi:Flp pilus assembly protein TadG
MKQVDFKFARHVLHETDGAEIAEAAVVLPVMFMVLLGIFWFGQAFSIYGAITRAAQEGVRAGSAPLCTTCGSYNGYAAAAQSAVNTALIASNLDPAQIQMTSQPVFTPCGAPLPMCAATGAACVQFPVQLVTQTQTLGTPDCGISVSLQYPFKFWLPFTSINNQLILLSASASAKMETD